MLLVVIILSGCTTQSSDGNLNSVDTVEYDSIEYINKNNLTVSIDHAKGEFVQSEEIINFVNIENNTDSTISAYIQSDLILSSDEVYSSNIESYDILSNESKSIKAQIKLEDKIETGRYKTKITVWDGDPESKETKQIRQSISEEIILYQNKENFSIFDETVWGISNKQLGKTYLNAENTYVQEGLLKIRLAQNKLEGGEIYSINNHGYGIYEIRMKLPSAESSITGFFMYMKPDFFYEIDMEMFNDSSGTLLLTTYAEGDVSNTEEYMLGFDLTKDFHDYRFEYFEDNIKFYIDNQFIKEYRSGIPKKEMQLMVNCWYPVWLGMSPTLEEKELLIDWLKY